MKKLSSFTIVKKYSLLTHQEKHLTITNTILSFGLGLSSLFMNIYLWKQTDGIVSVVIFNLLQYPGMIFIFLIVGIFPFRLQLKKLLALGFVLFSISYFFLILAGNQASVYLIPLGILFGLATGVFWSANNAFIYLSTTDKNRDNYFAINSTAGNIIAILSPLIAGMVLSQTNFLPELPNINYYMLFSIVISVFIFGFYYTHKLPSERMQKITIKMALRPIKVKVWRIVGLSAFIDGFKGGSSGFIATILTFQIITHEVNMAFFSSAFSIISAIISYFLIGRLKPENRLKYGFIGAFLFILVHISFIIFFSTGGIILSSLINVFATSLFTLGLASTFFLLLDSHPEHKKEYYSYIAFREIPLNLGRILGAGIFLLLLNLGNEIEIAKVWYLLLGVAPLCFYFLTHRFNKIIEHEFRLLKVG